jgi:hypothetical protein
MKNIIGPPVTGEELKFRDKEVSDILTMLGEGNSILLIGLRRIGKSSVMKAIEDRAPEEWLVSYHSVQDKRTPSDLFSILLGSLSENDFENLIQLWSQFKTVPARVINGIKQAVQKLGGYGMQAEFNQSIIEYWQPLTKGIERIIADKKSPITLILDEFPFFIEHMLNGGTSPQAVEEILGLLKKWRGDYSHFRLLVGGSISMDRILAKWNIDGSTINDFLRYYLPPLSTEESRQFLKELAISCGLDWYDDEKIEESLELLEDYYPFFMQALFLQIKNYGDSQKPLAVIFEQYFIPSIQKSYFNQFNERLKKHYRHEQRLAAKAMFKFISKQANLRASYSQLRVEISQIAECKSVELDDLLIDLISDEFLTLDSRVAEYGFTANLVAKWWRITRGN